MGLAPATWDGVALLAAIAAPVAAEAGGCEDLGTEDEKCDSMHSVTWASRATSEPSAPLGGRALWQMGHSSSSRS